MDPVIRIEDLPRTANAHELVGADYGVPVSLILVYAPPGSGPALHRHPYAEIFVIEQGQATIHVDDTVRGRRTRQDRDRATELAARLQQHGG